MKILQLWKNIDIKKHLLKIFRGGIGIIPYAGTLINEYIPNKTMDKRPPKERFVCALNDYENWERTQGVEDTYFYTKNPQFKMIRHSQIDDNYIAIDDMENYACLVRDFGILTDYWDFHKNDGGTYEDYVQWFDVELFIDNTSIGIFNLFEFYSKYFFTYKGCISPLGGKFYLPLMHDIETKLCYPHDKNGMPDYCQKRLTIKDSIFNAITNDIIFKICRVLYRKEYRYDTDIDTPYRDKCVFGHNYEKVLEMLNWDAITNANYFKENEDYIYEIVITRYMNNREWVKRLRQQENKQKP